MEEIDYHINFYDNTNIKELVRNDFNIKKKRLKDKKLYSKNGIIIFYSNLCISCKKNYNMLVNLSDMYYKKFNIYAVNCNNIQKKNDYLIQDFKITEYPMYKLIIKNKIKDIKIKKIKLENLLFLIDNNLNNVLSK